jgi:hypothetical protein
MLLTTKESSMLLHKSLSHTRRVLVIAFITVIGIGAFTANEVLQCVFRPPPSPKVTIIPHGRVYVSSILWNFEQVSRDWTAALLDLVQKLGSENVFVAIHESGSWDGTKSALRELNAALEAHGVQRNITLSGTTDSDAISVFPLGSGWVETPDGSRRLRRVPPRHGPTFVQTSLGEASWQMSQRLWRAAGAVWVSVLRGLVFSTCCSSLHRLYYSGDENAAFHVGTMLSGHSGFTGGEACRSIRMLSHTHGQSAQPIERSISESQGTCWI